MFAQFDSEGDIVALFHMPQNDAQVPNCQEIADDDPRIAAFMNRPVPIPPAPTKYELLAQIADLTAKVNALP